MKNKKLIISIITCILFLLIGGFAYYFFTKEDKVTTLNLFEKQWIENNKNNVIDMSIVSDIPVLSYNGEGIIVDFLDSLNKETSLSFNKVSYRLTDGAQSEYAFKMVDNVSDKDILVYIDNYVLVTKNGTKLSFEDLENLNIGLLSDNLNSVNNYLYNSKALYKTYENIDQLLAEFNTDATNLDAVVLLKTADLKTIIDNKYTIAYNITDYNKYFVLSLGNTERLNDILTKYFNKWSSINYDQSYNKYLSKNYFNFNNINDAESVKFRSKRYVYGFIENASFDTILDNKLSGINNEVLSSFSKLTNAEISYKKFDSISSLVDSFNKNEIDIFYGINEDVKYAIDVIKTHAVYDNNVVILRHASNNKIINSIKSLSDVYVLENTQIAKYLTDNGISLKQYKNMEDLINNVDTNSIIAMDLLNYNYYINKLDNFLISYQIDDVDYSFIIRDISDNLVFGNFLNFHLDFNDSQTFINKGLSKILIIDKTPIILRYVALALGSLVILLLTVLAIIKIKPKKNKVSLSKEDKLRYIDALTSLKNRNYLNDSIEKWDNSEIYPQTIIIIDLNNVAYINDNYGHSEGDDLIKQAANVLILNQLENSEIIRTNGNEFLIYLVNYDEKQVITYIRKLNKELKELKHGFGAAIGYSVINDAIKTIDDAINEATLDMRNNKNN